MYRDRGIGGSKSEVGPVARKRINDALDKHLERSSPSTSRTINGKEFSSQSLLMGKQPSDHKDPLSKNNASDGIFFFTIFFTRIFCVFLALYIYFSRINIYLFVGLNDFYSYCY